MESFFEAAAERRAGAPAAQQGAYHTAYLDDGQGGARSSLLMVMADGIEGHGSGQVACSLVVSTFHRKVARAFGRTKVTEALRTAVSDANQALGDSIEETPDLGGMACTLVGAVLSGNRLHWASVGDSQLWLLRAGKLHKLNADHSYGGYLQRMRDQGVELDPEPGLTPDMLMSAVTGAALEEVDCPDEGLELQPGDRIVIASAALRAADTRRIVQTASHGKRAGDAVPALLSLTGESEPDGRRAATVMVADVRTREPKSAAAATGRADGNGRQPQPRTAQPPPKTAGATLRDVLTGVLSLVIFAATAGGTWYGLGVLDEFRSQLAPPTPSRRVTAPAPSAPTGESGATGSGRTLGQTSAPGQRASGGAGSGVSLDAPASPAGSSTGSRPAAPEGPAAVDGVRDALEGGGQGPVLVTIPAGRFEMGGGPLSTQPEERPRHAVTVDAFALGRYEVTIAEYQRFAQATGRRMPDINMTDAEIMPVTRVTWDEAYAYTNWLSRQTGKRYRLPSEAEWEYAAAAGTATPYWWGREAGEGRAHCLDCGTGLNPRRATRVGRFPANPFGLHDTAGNVAEWVHDCWHPNYRGAPDDGSVWEGGDCTARVVRGGAFSSPPASIRVQARARAAADQALDTVGFRIAREP